MADLKQRISDDVKTAMRNKERERLATLRLIQAAIKQKEVDERIELNDAQTLAVLDKMARQHQDSITQYEKAVRDDLVEKEQAELAIVKEYLPEQLSEDEIREQIRKAIEETGAESMKDMGKVMGLLKPRLQGRADMGRISGLVKEQLS